MEIVIRFGVLPGRPHGMYDRLQCFILWPGPFGTCGEEEEIPIAMMKARGGLLSEHACVRDAYDAPLDTSRPKHAVFDAAAARRSMPAFDRRN